MSNDFRIEDIVLIKARKITSVYRNNIKLLNDWKCIVIDDYYDTSCVIIKTYENVWGYVDNHHLTLICRKIK
jgi:hypothetical protein